MSYLSVGIGGKGTTIVPICDVLGVHFLMVILLDIIFC